MMLPRASLGRTAARVWRNGCYQQTTVRGMASQAGLEFETSESAGVKLASREISGPTTTLTVVAKAGSRYEPLPGYSEALEKFAFKVSPKPPGKGRLPINQKGYRVYFSLWRHWLMDWIPIAVYSQAFGPTNHP